MNAKVMVVDDSMMVRQQVKRALGEAGFTMVEACDGVDALKKLSEETDVKLIVLDVNMPNMNGIEFLEALRRDRPDYAVNVVMLTTEGQPDLVQRAKSLGAKGWVIKPFKAELMVAAAKKLTQ